MGTLTKSFALVNISKLFGALSWFRGCRCWGRVRWGGSWRRLASGLVAVGPGSSLTRAAAILGDPTTPTAGQLGLVVLLTTAAGMGLRRTPAADVAELLESRHVDGGLQLVLPRRSLHNIQLSGLAKGLHQVLGHGGAQTVHETSQDKIRAAIEGGAGSAHSKRPGRTLSHNIDKWDVSEGPLQKCESISSIESEKINH